MTSSRSRRLWPGASELTLGRGAAALGRLDLAVDDLAVAAEQADRAGAPRGFAAEARYHLAAALLARNGPGDLAAPANHRDDGLLAATLDAIGGVGPLPAEPVVHLEAGYDYQPCRQALTDRGMMGQIATRGLPAPIQAGRRWPVERTHAWSNQYGKLRWCTERRRLVVAFWLALASAVIVCGRLIRRAWTHYRWEGRPRRRP